MRQLLVLNPNTSTSVTKLLQTHVQAVAGPAVRVRSVTARFGAPYIACEASYAVAAHAALDAWAAALQEGEEPAPDTVLIGCFGDPGLFALRDSSPVPVTGLAEAACVEAARHGRFAIVTGGARWVPMLERLALTLGHGDALVGIHTVAPTGAELAADPMGAQALLAQACREAAERWQARAVIVGGAGLAGVAAAIQSQVDVPLIDSVAAGTRHALALAAPPHAGARAGFDVAWQGLSPELTALGHAAQP
ncbi:aspartate/glutamate racemase family protein [Pseudorhodoferax sp. Leaf267]|uniref:aspartate/glutamate racemase family protein n=1 Tax=Pseudorhodoferax sp. Leaf267 TaxID=1736316 RepID=UPI0006F3A01A|nr:aspartate/glutamate racemase family protein [Pseudorhodoferax sp. Leaf267]KQP12001.1 Asp/Glu racemase [Pseudorhodoferax sp. Leaf267]